MSPEYVLEVSCALHAPALVRLELRTVDHRWICMTLEQMYNKTAPKIVVFAPNCWETLTEFSRHNNRMGI
jgi:hypothetical protein